MSIVFETRIGPKGVYGTVPTFEQMHFPAGEAHLKVINEQAGKGPIYEVATVRTPTADDLVMLRMWADACARIRFDRRDHTSTAVLMPYLPGARADRGNPLGAAVYADLINGGCANELVAMDVHSPVMLNLTGATDVGSAALVRHAVVGKRDDEHPQAYGAIIAPDAGAVPRAQAVADACHLPLVRATKHRDPDTGGLFDFECEPVDPTVRHLVVDDICDGGGTFLGLAESTGLDADHLDLWVTHSVFSRGAERLPQKYGRIFSTDSYDPQTALPNHTIIPARPYLLEAIA